METEKKVNNQASLFVTWIDTPLGPMIAIADKVGLYMLEFVERQGLKREIERMQTKLKSPIIPGSNEILIRLNQALSDYFSGVNLHFDIPIHFLGSAFQVQVWKALMQIPVGATSSYAHIAQAIQRPSAYRAVARANASNHLALIIPCHRVINTNGALGGYAGGVERKQWLIEHEEE